MPAFQWWWAYEAIILSATMDAWGHHIARCRAVGIEAVLCQPFADDGAVSHHADQMVVLPDRNGAYIMLTHQFREVGDRGVRTDPSRRPYGSRL